MRDREVIGGTKPNKHRERFHGERNKKECKMTKAERERTHANGTRMLSVAVFNTVIMTEHTGTCTSDTCALD